MGSRIRRDKLFWFGAIDSYRRNDPGVAMVKNPSEFFNLPEPTSAAVTLLSAQLGESTNQAYNDYLGVSAADDWQSPQAAGLEQLAGLLGPAARTAAQWVGFARIDWQAAERHHFTLEGIGADWNAPGGGLTRVSEDYGNHSFGSSEASQQWLLARWEAYLTPNLLAVTQGSAGRDDSERAAGNAFGIRTDIAQWRISGASCRRSSWTRATDSLSAIPRVSGRAVIPTKSSTTPRKCWTGCTTSCSSRRDSNWITTMTRPACCAIRREPIPTPLLRASSPMRWLLRGSASPMRSTRGIRTTAGRRIQNSAASLATPTTRRLMGPTNWHLSTNDWAGYATAQWQAAKFAVFSGGLALGV